MHSHPREHVILANRATGDLKTVDGLEAATLIESGEWFVVVRESSDMQSPDTVRVEVPALIHDPTEHEKRLKSKFWQALKDDAGKSALLLYPEFLARRLRVLERTLRALLASGSLSDGERAHALALLYGAPGRFRDGKLLNEHEGKMIEAYRTMDTTGKQMLRTLLARLAATSQGESEAR